MDMQGAIKTVSLQTSSRSLSNGVKTGRQYLPETSELCLYEGELMTKQDSPHIILKVLTAFPTMQKGQVQMLVEMMIDEGFTRQRAMDSVSHVIKTYQGWDKNPNIANFIQWDKRIKIYTYWELDTKDRKGELIEKDYERIDLGHDKPRFARREDVEKFNLKKWETT